MEWFFGLTGYGIGTGGSLASNGDFDITARLGHELTLFRSTWSDEEANVIVARVLIDGDVDFLGGFIV